VSKTITVYKTKKDSNCYLQETEKRVFLPDESGVEASLVNLYPEKTYQTVRGFGGSFTEAAAYTFSLLTPELQEKIIELYFDPKKGIGYELCRTHINSCDFSLGNYHYTDSEDPQLQTFSIEHERKWLIPLIQKAMKAKGKPLQIIASPWSPPDWMKTNGKMNQGGHLKPEYRQTWAEYIAEFLLRYREEGIVIKDITVQNEPKALQTWDSCLYSAEEEKVFVRDYLRPVLDNSELENVNIIIWDHNKERVYERARDILSDKKANEAVNGIGFHWYSGDHFEGLSLTNESFPDKELIFTEGCIENGPRIGEWETGERYAHDLIGNLNHFMNGWVDWNLLLNEEGGPNHVGNFCDSPIIADTKKQTLTINSSYYYIAHFSKFIPPSSKRIGLSRFTQDLEVTAFLTPEDKIITVVLNQTENDIPFTLREMDGIASLISDARSIMTLVIEEDSI
jgi:glucosylceramidase